jgi:hypothetical protein
VGDLDGLAIKINPGQIEMAVFQGIKKMQVLQ